MSLKTSLVIENQYFGNVVYYKMLFQYSHIIIDAYEHYQKMSFRNRCQVLGANGLIALSIPILHGRNQKSVMKEVQINGSENWQKNHWRTLVAAYGRSPFFEYYQDELFQILHQPYQFLFDLNWEILSWTKKQLKLGAEIHPSEAIVPPNSDELSDFRNRILPKNYLSFPEISPYQQVFEHKFGFQPNLSILDLLFNTGPMASHYLQINS